MQTVYLDQIKSFEGFAPKAEWDYAQFTNGYGTKARYAGEVISKTEAERRFKTEIAEARSIVEKAAPNVDEGTKAALTSLTYNAGSSWVKSGLGEAVRTGDLDRAREIFVQYNKAGGEVVPGLVNRRLQEAAWIGSGSALSSAAAGLAALSGAQAAGVELPPVPVPKAPSIVSVRNDVAQFGAKAGESDALGQLLRSVSQAPSGGVSSKSDVPAASDQVIQSASEMLETALTSDLAMIGQSGSALRSFSVLPGYHSDVPRASDRDQPHRTPFSVTA